MIYYFLFKTAHGRKRSEVPPRAIRPPMKLNDRFALIKILPDKVVSKTLIFITNK